MNKMENELTSAGEWVSWLEKSVKEQGETIKMKRWV